MLKTCDPLNVILKNTLWEIMPHACVSLYMWPLSVLEPLAQFPKILYWRLHESFNFSFFIHNDRPRLRFGFLVDDMQFSRYDCSKNRVIRFLENVSPYLPHLPHEADISQIDFLWVFIAKMALGILCATLFSMWARIA